MTLVFWNTKKLRDLSRLARLVDFYDVDILLLAEFDAPIAEVSRMLSAGPSVYSYALGLCERIQVYSRLPFDSITPTFEADRLTIRRVAPPIGLDFLLACVHFPSKNHWDPSSQVLECSGLIRAIEEEEGRHGHSRTLLLGDFNMNPFEPGVVGSRGLHATMSRTIASEGGREVQGSYYGYFYNPMWGRFGDSTEGPPGTYYYRRAEHLCYFWNIFDQCLVRPDLLYAFDDSMLKVLTSDGSAPLVSAPKGIPSVSDHLPILVEVNP